MAAGALGFRDPTSPGTTTEASAAMSAARATTLGSRTSGANLTEIGVAAGRRRDPVRALQRTREPDERCRSVAPWRRGVSRTVDARRAGRPAGGARAARARLRRPDDAGRRGSGDSRLRDARRARVDRDPGRRRRGPGAGLGPGRGASSSTGLPALLGLDDDDTGLRAGPPPGGRRARAAARPGPAGPDGAVWEALLPAILEQRITGTEAWRNYRRLVRAHGAPAPGPLGLLLAPDAGRWSRRCRRGASPALGIEPRRGALLRRIAREAPRFEALGSGRAAPRRRRRGRGGPGRGAAGPPGIGPWTAAEVTLRALGDPDAVSVGDAHLVERRGLRADRRARAARTSRCSSCSRRGPATAPASSGSSRRRGITPAALRPARRAARPRPGTSAGPRAVRRRRGVSSGHAGHAEVREVAAGAGRALRRGPRPRRHARRRRGSRCSATRAPGSAGTWPPACSRALVGPPRRRTARLGARRPARADDVRGHAGPRR